MEVRTCLCGCGNQFKVSDSNTINWFSSIGHAMMVKHKRDKVGAIARQFLKSVNLTPWGYR